MGIWAVATGTSFLLFLLGGGSSFLVHLTGKSWEASVAGKMWLPEGTTKESVPEGLALSSATLQHLPECQTKDTVRSCCCLKTMFKWCSQTAEVSGCATYLAFR